jgi:ATP-dependent helicase YprA (DUF1998 family)
VTSLLPSLQAADLRKALTAYLSTTFALTDDDVRASLEAFLADGESGIFRGPYVRLRLPFRPADGTWSVPLDWYPSDWTPYGHQARAFERLSSKHHRPEPTLVTTGTGSGKTEAFLYPVIDHALRAKNRGQRGIKALVLYPMNALANDQAARLATLLTSDDRLGGLSAGLYTGERGSKRTKVNKDGLITERAIMRDDPPDILLTNYRMLDQLLLRSADVSLWHGAEESLTYLVLDEFHTYDGAQGTDVAMLLRRLGAALGVASDGAPLGGITPVATSATLGPGGDSPEASTAMRQFAAAVFGRPFDAGSVITEDRMALAEWQDERRRSDAAARADAGERASYRPRALVDAATMATAIRGAGSEPRAAIDALIGLVVERDSDANPELDARAVRRLRESRASSQVLTDHPLTAALLEHAQRPITLAYLAELLFPGDVSQGRADGITVIDTYLGLLSLVRADLLDADAGRRFLSVDVQLWVREISRVDRLVSSVPEFRWADDGEATHDAGLYLAAIYCRHCGRSGWGTLRHVTGASLDIDVAGARAAIVTGNDRFRALIYAGGEAAAVEADPDVTIDGLRWLDLASNTLLASPPDDADDEPQHVPVLVDWEGEKSPRDEVCPSCHQQDAIRFLGTRSSTLASVTLSTLFGSASLNPEEKKTLLFTDSVQDAAHAAGFVQARSHTMSRRAAIRAALGREALSLPDVSSEMLDRAGDDPYARYRLVPPELVHRKRFAPYWQQAGGAAERTAKGVVKARLEFDLALEFGLQSRTGRTLELTGSAVTEVDVGVGDRLLRVATAALVQAREQHSLSPEFDAALRAGIDVTRIRGWARGVLERMRTQGGIHHPWLDGYLRSDGNRWFLWGGRTPALRERGMPAFPPGRPSPAFPTSNPMRETLDSFTGPTSWYVKWAIRQLGVTSRDGGLVTGALLARAATEGWLVETATDSNARVYRIPPQAVLIHVPADAALRNGSHSLRCQVCHTVTPGAAATIDDLDGAACLRQGCPGQLFQLELDDDYYRGLYASSDMRRVVAREHTSLLPDKVRLEHEEDFKSGRGPDVPNVLAATPTLELGIDIGDLSTVMLGSLPREVASYVQRVGRAGRLTGNALILAYVQGRGANLQRLSEPTSLIDGEVRPPATYLDAVEILQRQYVAYLVDQRGRAGVDDPSSASVSTRDLLGAGWDPGTWIGDLLVDTREHAEEYVDRFIGLFGELIAPDTATDLRLWCGDGLPDGETSGLERVVHAAVRSYKHELNELGHRSAALQDVIPDLRAATERVTATGHAAEDEKNDLRAAEAELRALEARRAELLGQYWVSALEERGVLPNYTLLDDNVRLDVSLGWFDHDSGEYNREPRRYHRGASVALTDFAPGATFYAQGIAIVIDAVDVGTGLDSVRQQWRLCASCGWSTAEGTTSEPIPDSCPRCGDISVRDVGQRLDVIPLERVSAEVSRDAALISDSRDDRTQERFTVVPLVDVDPARVSDAWRLTGYPFGAEYVRDCQIRWINVGSARLAGPDRLIAGNEVRAPLFRLCPECGVVRLPRHRDDTDVRHRGWCPHRRDPDIDWQDVALGRSLRTQAVQLLVPPHFTRDTFAGASFRAALLLGLREVIGGAPDHLTIVETHAPVDQQDRIVLVLHDTVPGGTGYLADFARPSRVRDVLASALAVVEACPCRDEDVLACHRCLMPFTPPSLVDRTSRARAEQLIQEILTAGREDASPDDAALWVTEDVSSLMDVQPDSPESHLEQRFRATLVDELRARGADLREEPHVDGTVVHISMPGARRRQWVLRPQPRLLGTQPDFVLMADSPDVPAMYIYTDGRRYHAHPEANRLADDADKRERLRLAGHVVWAVSSADLDAFERVREGNVPVLSSWFTESVRDKLTKLRAQEVLTAGSVSDDLVAADAVSQIVTWIASPDVAAWRSLASVLPLAFFGAGRAEWHRERLSSVTLSLLDGEALPGSDPGGIASWWWREGGLVLVAATRHARDRDVGAVLAIDDRDATLETDAAADEWHSWLALSNVLGLAGRRPDITTRSRLLAAREPMPAAVAEPGTPEISVVSVSWQALLDAAVDDDERRVLGELASAGLPLPEQGYETDAGIPLDLAWPDQRVAVVFTDDQVDTLAREGWQAMLAGTDDLAGQLTAVLSANEVGG